MSTETNMTVKFKEEFICILTEDYGQSNKLREALVKYSKAPSFGDILNAFSAPGNYMQKIGYVYQYIKQCGMVTTS